MSTHIDQTYCNKTFLTCNLLFKFIFNLFDELWSFSIIVLSFNKYVSSCLEFLD